MSRFTQYLSNRLVPLSVLLASALLAPALSGCARGPASIREIESPNKQSKVAVVSLSINSFGNQMQGWNSENVGDLMSDRAAKMLRHTESVLGGMWTIVPTAEFVNSPGYQAQKGYAPGVYSPSRMVVMGHDRKELIKSVMSAEQAKALAKESGADRLVVVYTEWGVATGKFVPTSKPLTKTIVSIYDAAGNQIFTKRKDVMGDKTLGALGMVTVDESTIEHWVDGYKDAINFIVGQPG